MKTLMLVGFVGISVIAGTIGGWKLHAAAKAREERVKLQREEGALRAQVVALTARQKASMERSAAVEADNTLLQEGLAKVKDASAPPARSREAAAERIKAAVRQASKGDPAQVLRELLWCLDEGVLLLEGGSRHGQRHMVMAALGRLVERYPPAAAVLRERWAEVRARYLETGDLDGNLSLFAGLSDALGEREAVLALYDQLPEGDSRRRSLASHAYGAMLEARRYQEANATRDWSSMISDLTWFERMRTEPQRRRLLESAAKNIEVLAGAGELDNARKLAGKVLELDGSDQTRTLLQNHLKRAGQAGLLDAIPRR